MVLNEKFSQDFIRRNMPNLPAASEEVRKYFSRCLIDVTPEDERKYGVTIFANMKDRSDSRFHLEGISEEALFGRKTPTAGEKSAIENSEMFWQLKQLAPTNPDVQKIVEDVENGVIREVQDYMMKLIAQENECGFGFQVWNMDTDDDGVPRADILVNLGEKEHEIAEMARQELMNLGYSEYDADDKCRINDYFIFVRASDGEEDFSLEENGGGFQFANPQRASQIFLLLENSEIVGTGYLLTKAECEAVREFSAEKFRKAREQRSIG